MSLLPHRRRLRLLAHEHTLDLDLLASWVLKIVSAQLLRYVFLVDLLPVARP